MSEGHGMYTELAAKDARLAELEAENARLKVCGSCHMWKPVPDADDTYCCTCIIIGADPAHAFGTCSRWAEREAL